MPKSPKNSRSDADPSPVVSVSRFIPLDTKLSLFVGAGGRCEFDGCNKFLLEHPLTGVRGNFAQMAHIVAFSRQGPRGDARSLEAPMNNPGNLMLLCPQCHKLIDDRPTQFSVETLEKYKQNHESRVRHVTGLGPDLKTTVVQVKAKVAGQAVAIPIAQVTEAVAPRYPNDARGYVIDLTGLEDGGRPFYETAAETIRVRIERLYEPGMDVEETRHISLFALAPIPLLMFLGRQLSNKVPVDVYQRHRDTEDWVWKTGCEPAQYRFEAIRRGHDRTKVALVLSLSGTIPLDSLPRDVVEDFTVYELTLASSTPSPAFLRTKEDLNSFKTVYQSGLRTILR